MLLKKLSRKAVYPMLGVVLAAGTYVFFHAKSAATPNGDALVWCGPRKGIYGVTFPEGSFDSPGLLNPLNGAFMERELEKLTNEATLDMADNPFAALGVGFMNQLSESITQGLDTAIDDECGGETGAIAGFFDRLSSIGEADSSVSSGFDSSYSASRYDSEPVSSRSTEPVVREQPKVKAFSCLDVSKPSVLEDEMVFRVENNCGTELSLVNWDVNVFEAGTDRLLDTGTLQVSDLYAGSEKQDGVYLEIPSGEFRYELVPSTASPDEVVASGVRTASPNQPNRTNGSPAAQPEVNAKVMYVESNDGEANLRPFASTENAPTGVLVNGDAVTILEETTNSSGQRWALVDSRLGEGWVFTGLLSDTGAQSKANATCVVKGASDEERYRGDCVFQQSNGDGSFSIQSPSGLIDGYLSISVTVMEPGIAEVRGLTTGGINSRRGQAERSQSDPACWVGEDFSICAY